jgi:hypothetical protein
MGWDKGRYYTRSKKVNGRVVREYLGTGPSAQIFAEMDELRRLKREGEREERKAVQAEIDALDAPLNELNELADLAARAVLLNAGYRQHHRGAWRKSRGRRK